MIQLTRSGTAFSGSHQDIERLRLEFDRQHWIRLSKLLDPGLLELILHQIEKASFSAHTHEGIGLELCMRDTITSGLLHFVSNDQKLIQIVQDITRCGRIGSFGGRVYRMMPGSGHYDSWHTDMADHRLIALSINLSTEVYSGGVLEIREVGQGRTLAQVTNTGLGDGILFRLSHRLEHRVSSLEGTIPKTAFAGWFRSEPEFHVVLRQMCSGAEDLGAGKPPEQSSGILGRQD